MRFVHTADWHIGKVFRYLDDAVESRVREARLEAITIIGQAARGHGARHVVVAGDVFDHDRPSEGTLAKPLERMIAFPDLGWHLIPGNHDPARPDGVWDRFLRLAPPAHVQVHLEPGPVDLAPGITLLPAPLGRARSREDPTGWMDDAPTPAGTLRIGLAHGAVRDFGQTPNVIAPDRAARAGLDWLALGDWHQELRLGPRTAYSGTPEPDGFGQPDAGGALLVDLAGPGAEPIVTTLLVARYRWYRDRATVQEPADIERLEARLRALTAPDPARCLVDLTLDGALSLDGLGIFSERIAGDADGGRLRSALASLRVDLRGLIQHPNPRDLDAIATSGAVRTAAERLLARTETADDEGRSLALRALLHLRAASQRSTPA